MPIVGYGQESPNLITIIEVVIINNITNDDVH